MSVNSRIKERRESLNMSRIELAEKIGVTASAVANYENEISSPKIEVMYKIFDALKCDANYLYQDEMESSYPLKVSYKEYEHIEKYRYITEHSPEGANMVNSVLDREFSIAKQLKNQKERIQELENEPPSKIVPMRVMAYYQRMASAGSGEYLFDDIPTDLIEVEDTPLSRKADFVLGVNGRSMEPTYNDGDKVLVRKTSDIPVGQIGVFTVDGKCYIKELGKNRLISHNEDKETYPDILPDEGGIVIVGEVLGRV